ncbi:MAG: hypothetical protein R3D83_11065 [Caenibius sp.]
MADDGQGSSAAAGDDDLPDIVDVVMEMGRDPQPAVTQAPSPLPVMTVETRLPGHLQGLADRARDYVEAASSANTRRAYASDWKHFAGWCRRQGVETVPPDPRTVGLYITALAAGTASGDKKSVSTIERRLSSLSWNFSQRGQPLDRKDRHIATVMAGIRNKHASPPRQKEAILPEDLIAMLETLDRGTLRGLRDRAMLLLGFAGGLRRSEITGLDCGRDQTEDGRGWIEFFPTRACWPPCVEKPAGVRSRSAANWLTSPARWWRSKPGSSSPASPTARCFAASPVRANRSALIGSTTRRLRVWSSVRRSPQAFAATSPKASAGKNSPAIHCAPASPPRPRSMNVMCKSNLATPAPR